VSKPRGGARDRSDDPRVSPSVPTRAGRADGVVMDGADDISSFFRSAIQKTKIRDMYGDKEPWA
jgi:hypothetical protein